MFSKILIANRGEIAVRIIRACKEMGVATVAVYSEADKNALHVALADQSYCIGDPEASESYLNPAVVECSVIGVPDALRGQAIKAVIVLGAGYEPSPELELKIKNFCNQKLAEYKWIRLVEFVTEMPKTISGKIQKTVLRNRNETV